MTVFPFVSMFALRKDRGNMRGRLWISVVIDGRLGYDSEDERTRLGGKSPSLFYLYSCFHR